MERKRLVSILIIVAAGATVYLNSLHGAFLWDDVHFIVNNRYLRDWSHLLEIFTQDVAAGSGERYGYYRPLTVFTYLIDYTLWGLDVRGYHMGNVLFHVLAAVALYVLVDALFRERRMSFLCSLFFVLHPIHTETVAYVSGRPDALAAFFMFACMALYVRGEGRHDLRASFGPLLCCIGAAFSRENVVVLLPLLVVYHMVFHKPVRRRLIPIALVVLVYAALKMRSLGGGDVQVPTAWFERLPGFMVAVATYFRLLLLPFGQHQEYGDKLFSAGDPAALAGLAITLLLLAAAWLAARCMSCSREPRTGPRLLLFSILWFFAALLPGSGLYPLKTYMAEHWLYVPSAGFFLVLAFGVTRLRLMPHGRPAAAVAAAALVLFFGARTLAQNAYFREPISFYERTVEYTPHSARLLSNLGNEYVSAGRTDEAIALFERAIAADPMFPSAYSNLGHMLMRQKRYEEARLLFEKALARDPRCADACCNLGVLYVRTGRLELAARCFERGLTIRPHSVDLLFNLGLCRAMSGDPGSAVSFFEKAVAIDASHGRSHRQLAILYGAAGDHARAAVHRREAERLGCPMPRPRPDAATGNQKEEQP